MKGIICRFFLRLFFLGGGLQDMKMTKKDWAGVAAIVVALGLLLACSFVYLYEQNKSEPVQAQSQQTGEQLFFSAEIIADPVVGTLEEKESSAKKEKKAASEYQTVNVFLIAL